jgi:hypothetical protein
MDVTVRLTDLTKMHAQLLWDEFVTATVAVLSQQHTSPFRFELRVTDVPGFDDDTLVLTIRPPSLTAKVLEQLQRTYEPARLIESAAIALAGLGLYHAGRHEIRNVAFRGSGADYLVDDDEHLLEIAGRSRSSDLQAAWDQRWDRLMRRRGNGFYVFVAEFATFSGRLGFLR